MTQMTDQLNLLVANYIQARDSEGAFDPSVAASMLADFCADIFQKRHVARTDDGQHEFRVELKPSADQFREAWRKESSVSQFELKLAVMINEPRWYAAHKGGMNRP